MSLDGIEQLDELARHLEGVERRAAARAAPALLAVAAGQWAAGQAPDGISWAPTKDGKVALTGLTSRATARAEDSTIVLELPDEAGFHQNPRQAGHPRRQMFPNPGDEPPAAWEEPVRAALEAELGEG